MAALRRLDLDTRSLIITSLGMTTREVGEQWLALLRGEDSAFGSSVVRERCYAGKRLPAPCWQSTRERIFARDGRVCTYCGSSERLECDHVVPVAKGGGHDDGNLTTACRSCNRRKRDLMPTEWMA